MRKFKDSEGVDWTLDLNQWSAMAIKRECGVDILDIAEGKDLIVMTNDVITLGAVLWLLVADQAQERQLDEKAFFKRLNGDALDAATKTLVAECFDFFPPEKRSLLSNAYNKIVGMQNKQLAKAEEIIEKMTEEQLESLATGSVSDLRSLVKSGSNPGGSPSAS